MCSPTISMNGSFIPPHPPPSDYHDRRNSTTTQADLPDDSLSSHRASISTTTDDFSSPRSWDGEGPFDCSPTATEFDGKILQQHPRQQQQPQSTTVIECPPHHRYDDDYDDCCHGKPFHLWSDCRPSTTSPPLLGPLHGRDPQNRGTRRGG